MKDVKIICVICGKDHYVSKSNKNIKCCSRGCANKYRASKIVRPVCSFCGKIVNRRLSHCYRNGNKKVFCNKICEGNSTKKRIAYKCEVCQKQFERMLSKKRNRFCSRKCTDIGLREWRKQHLSPQYRSYGECAMLVLLRKNFGDIDFIPNDRKQLNGFEIDIWIPKLNTGIEYNGPHHFKPVYGEAVFEKTKWADKTKREVAVRKGIKIIDLNVIYSISYTHKKRVELLFKNLCGQLNLEPKMFDFSSKEVLEERAIKIN